MQEPAESYEVNDGGIPFGAALLTIFLCVLFGANAVAVKISLTGVGAFTAAGFRFTIASIALFLWSKWSGKSLAINKKQLSQMIFISMVFFIQMSCFYQGMTKTTASHGTLIANILPFVVMILAHYFLKNDRINWKKIVGLLFGFAGVAALFFDAAGSGGSLSGDLIIMFAVLLWGVNVVYIKNIIDDFQPLQITIFPMIFSIPLFFTGAIIWDQQPIFLLSPEVIGALLYQSLITASFGFVMWNTLIQKYGATALHSFIFIMPISGVYFGVVLLGEPLSSQLLGSIILVSCGLLIVNAKRLPPWLSPHGRF